MGKQCWSCAPEKNVRPCWRRRTRIDPSPPAGPEAGRRDGIGLPVVSVVRGAPKHGVLHISLNTTEDTGASGKSDHADH